MRAPLAYVTRKNIIVEMHDDYPQYVTPDDKMIIRMLQLPPDKNKLLLEHMFIQSKNI